MRLIDIDVEIDRVCNEICGCDRKHCKWRVYGEEEGCNQIQELEKAKVVDAIPVEQLKYYDNSFSNTLTISHALKAWKNRQFPFFSGYNGDERNEEV
jgi:hypothetical protein